MSQDNVAVVRALLEAFNRRDAASMINRMHANFEWRPAITPGGIEGNVYRGPDGVRAWLAEVSESWQTLEAFGVELNAVGDRRVLALGRMRARGRASGVPLERELAQLWELENGKALRAVGYQSHAEALDVAGISR